MKLITTTALATVLLAGSAIAQNATTEATKDATAATTQMATDTTLTTEQVTADSGADPMGEGKLIRTRDITGGAIYTMNEADDEGWEMDWAYADVREKLNEIGEIEDIVLSANGDFRGIVAEIGGFLDIGDKHVMIPVGDVKLIAIDDQTYAYVTRLNEEQLEEMEGVDEGFWN